MICNGSKLFVEYSLLHLQIVPEHWMLLMICSNSWYVFFFYVMRRFGWVTCILFWLKSDVLSFIGWRWADWSTLFSSPSGSCSSCNRVHKQVSLFFLLKIWMHQSFANVTWHLLWFCYLLLYVLHIFQNDRIFPYIIWFWGQIWYWGMSGAEAEGLFLSWILRRLMIEWVRISWWGLQNDRGADYRQWLLNKLLSAWLLPMGFYGLP